MTILIACDKYKHSLSAIKVCKSIAKGLSEKDSTLKLEIHPMADGGDGTLAVLREHLELEIHECECIDPLGKPIHARYATFGITAYIELAEASGIALLKKQDLNPMITTTIGTGILIKDAIRKGFENIVLSIGGSCTTDAGLGIAQALGFKFLNSKGQELTPAGGNLNQIQTIVKPLEDITSRFTILCDVENTLYGPNGAAYVFSPQKGATKDQVKFLDQGLQQIAKLIYSFNGKQISKLQGGGAAGGISAGLYGLLDAEIKSGFSFLSHLSKLEEKIKSADLVITGEGQLDSQSFSGKVVGQIEVLCQKHEKPLIAIVGNTSLTAEEKKQSALQKVYSVLPLAKNLEDAMSNTEVYLFQIAVKIDLDQSL